MTISITHKFVSLKGNGTDNTQVQPTNWNDTHTIQMANNALIGNVSGAAGAAQEITISTYMAGLLATADQPTLAALVGGATTGTVKYTFEAAAPAGWLLLATGADTIGSATSGANLRANSDTSALYTLLWNSVGNTLAPVSGGRGASAAADFAANKTLTIPALVGRVAVGAGAATGWSTLKALGVAGGEETHLTTVNETPAHYHPATISDPGHFHTLSTSNSYIMNGSGAGIGGGGSFGVGVNGGNLLTAVAYTGVRVVSNNGNDTTYSAGGGLAHNNMQPFVGMNVMVKL